MVIASCSVCVSVSAWHCFASAKRKKEKEWNEHCNDEHCCGGGGGWVNCLVLSISLVPASFSFASFALYPLQHILAIIAITLFSAVVGILWRSSGRSNGTLPNCKQAGTHSVSSPVCSPCSTYLVMNCALTRLSLSHSFRYDGDDDQKVMPGSRSTPRATHLSSESSTHSAYYNAKKHHHFPWRRARESTSVLPVYWHLLSYDSACCFSCCAVY